MKLAIITAAAIIATASGHNHDVGGHHHCIHDHLTIPRPGDKGTKNNVKYDPGPTVISDATPPSQQQPAAVARSLETTKTASGQRQPLRIHTSFHFDREDALTQRIQKELMPAAVCMWNQALFVNHVVGPLRFDRGCSSHWQTDGKPCAAFDTAPDQCGDEALLDESWMNELTACTKATTAGLSECVTKSEGEGLDNTDFVIIVKAADTATCKSSLSTLGYAHACRYDQNDRPILGFINFCPKAVGPAKDDSAISTAAHELGHALGFSAGTWPEMRMKDGVTPRTPRDDTGRPKQDAIKCWNGQDGSSDERPAAANTLKRVTSRGNPNTFTLVTPSVREEARKHFGCDTLEGAELENQPTGSGSCWGSHWEQRILNNELMSPVGGNSAVLSRTTLAAFNDMGWYDVNYTMAGELEWGNGMGCEFVNDKCVNPTTGVAMGIASGYFCTSSGEEACSANKMSKSVCNVAMFNGNIEPSWFQHFADKTKGGALAELDYCPYFQAYSNQNCLDLDHAPLKQNARGESYGHESRCFDASLIQDVYVSSDVVTQTCFRRVCLDSGDVVRVFANDANGKEVSVDCSAKEAGTKKSMPSGFKGQLVCPDVKSVCRSRSGLDLTQCSSGSIQSGSTSSKGSTTGGTKDGGTKDGGTKDGGTITTPSSTKSSMSGGCYVHSHGLSKLLVVLAGLMSYLYP